MRNNSHHKIVHRKTTQQGFVLVVSLLILLVLTLLASSTIHVSTLNERMALNWQQSQQVFQAAESAKEAGIADTDLLASAMSSTDPNGASNTVNVHSSLTSTANAVYQGTSLMSGNSISVNGGTTGHRFEIRGSSTVTTTGVNVTTVQGFYILGPSS